MQLIIAKTIFRFYAIGLVVLSASFAVLSSGSFVTAGLLAVAVGLALLHRWAIIPACVVPMLYIGEFLADAFGVRWLRPSSVMPGIVALRFRSNRIIHSLLERPASFFAWYGVPKAVTIILLCAFAIIALIYAYHVLKRNGQLGVFSGNDKTSYLRTITAMSKLALGAGVLMIAIAVWNDPPHGGRNPSGPGPGATLVFAILRASPWLIIGSFGWAASAWLSRHDSATG